MLQTKPTLNEAALISERAINEGCFDSELGEKKSRRMHDMKKASLGISGQEENAPRDMSAGFKLD